MNDSQTIEELAGEIYVFRRQDYDMISRYALLLLFYTDVLRWRDRNTTLLNFKRPLMCVELRLAGAQVMLYVIILIPTRSYRTSIYLLVSVFCV